MSATIFNMNQLNTIVEKICEKAIRDTALQAREKLYGCVEEQYYNDPGFYPNVYKRTEEFLKHVTSQLLTSNTAQIYIDIDGMHYKTGFNPWQVVSWAAESKHGADYYQTNTTDFWTTFIDWCNDNLLDILKNNLRKYGLNIK